MKEVFVKDLKSYQLIDAPEPKIQSSGDIIVKVQATTVCGSDVHLLEGHMHTPWGFALGHEFVGVVHELGSDVKNFKIGDRVASPAAPYCGQCPQCKKGQIQACERGGIFGSGEGLGNLGGAQAEFVRVPFADSCVVKVPDSVSNAQALTVGDILATGWSAVKNAVKEPGKTLLIFGAGPVGLSAVHTARLASVAQVIAVDTVEDRLELAKKLGATQCINPKQQDVATVIKELTNGRGVDSIVDAAGVAGTIDEWLNVAAIGAKIAMVGIPSHPIELNLTEFLMKNISLWTGLGDLSTMPMLMEMIAAGILDPSPIFTEEVAFDDIETAIEEFMERKPGLIKPLINLN